MVTKPVSPPDLPVVLCFKISPERLAGVLGLRLWGYADLVSCSVYEGLRPYHRCLGLAFFAWLPSLGGW